MRRRTQETPLLGMLCLAFLPIAAASLQVESVKPPSIVNNLGKMAVIGQYDGISQYTFEGQQTTISTPYFDSIIAQVEDEIFLNQGTSNGRVKDWCQIDESVYMAGNFTKIGTVDTPGGFARLNASSGAITSLGQSLNGSIFALYCNSTSNSVYAGGNFTYENSTGAAVYDISSSSWSTPLFGGFASGASINAIVNFNNNLIFAGSFDGLANDSYTGSTSTQESNSTLLSSQRISFNSTTVNTAGSADGSDPRSIVCPSDHSDWVMSGADVGSWSALWPFSFSPTKMRLYNLKEEGKGTRVFRLLSFPSNGIMNLTFTNSSSDKPYYCDAWCDLPLRSDQEYVDFEFVNSISTSGLLIQILGSYNSSGGLGGIELWQNDLFTYANETFNRADTCVETSDIAQSTLTGDFVEPDVSGSTYVSINVTEQSQISGISAKFEPNVTHSGNYSILVYTPGCVQDGTCSVRQGVRVSVFATENGEPVNTTLYETNDYDKYDNVFTGSMSKISDGFRPYVTISPLSGNTVPFTFVADRIQTILHSIEEVESVSISTIFEYEASNFTNINNSSLPVGNTTINSLGSLLNKSAIINSLYAEDSRLLVGGKFSSSKLGDNIFQVTSDKAQAVNGSGLDGPVNGFLSNSDNSVVVFGNFSGLVKTSINGTNNVALYNLSADTWDTIGHGVSGEVTSATAMNLNGTSVLGFSGDFDKVYDNSSSALSVDGSGLWVPEDGAWFQDSSLSSFFLQARLSNSVSYNNTMFYAGYVRMFQSSSSGSSFLYDDLSVEQTPFTFVSNPSVGNTTRLEKRNTILQTGDNTINAGVFANSTFSVMAGHFRATANNQTFSNLIMLNSGNAQGLPNGSIEEESTFYDLYVNDGVLYAGGDFSGNVSGSPISGLFFYDLNKNEYMSIQPPGVSGDQAVVTSIEVRPNTDSLVVAGSFEQAGSLACNSLCIYDLSGHRWTTPAAGLTGIVSSMAFIGNDVLVLAGDLEVNNTKVYLAQYDFEASAYSTFGSQSTSLPGPINSFVLNGNKVDSVFASGLDSSSSNAYVSHWNGSSWNSIDSVIEAGSTVTELSLMELQDSHTANDVLPVNEVLLISGNIILKDFGNASAVFFDGSSWQPAFLTTMSDGSSGIINSFFSQSSTSFSKIATESHMDRGFVVLISLAIAIALTFICVALGLLVAYFRRRSQGYVQAPSRVSEAEMAETVPPVSLFEEMAAQPPGPRRRASGLL